MRAVIRANEEQVLQIVLHRSGSDTTEQAHETINEIASSLQQAGLPNLQIITPYRPHMPSGGPTQVSLIPATVPEAAVRTRPDGSLYEFTRLVAQPRDPLERGVLIDVLEDITHQHVTPVDALPAVKWCLHDLVSRRIDLFWDTDFSLNADEVKQLELQFINARSELLAPYLEGKHPVVQSELFAEFHEELDLLEQQVIAWACEGPSISQQKLDRYDSPASAMTWADKEELWDRLAANILSRNWLVEVEAPSWYNGTSLEPWLARGQKSKLLSPSQLITMSA